MKWRDAVALVGAEALRSASKTNQRSNWTSGRQPVPWSIIGPILRDRSSTTGPPPSAPAMHALLDCSILTAPERAMKDATFREAWKIVGQVWQRANPHRKKASPEDVEKWKALVITLRGFSPVGQTPEPAAEEPWPETGHPLHR